MKKIIYSLFKYMRNMVVALPLMFAGAVYATSSTNPGVMPTVGAPQSYQAHVDMNNCTNYIASSAYVIFAGNGGTNMKLQCPAAKPVMIYWQQQLGFGGFLAVESGGGQAWIKCCALAHSWKPVSPGAYRKA